jgi:heme exporter protein C
LKLNEYGKEIILFQNILKIILFIWIVLVILGAFLYAPTAKGLGEFTRVLFFHVPMAWITVLAFLLSAVYSILYLRNRQLRFDHHAEAANQLGILFAILATVTGSIWAKMAWGSFWNWDPRETSIFILLLIYAAYFALRSAIEQEDRKAALSAVYSILAFVTVPFFIFIVPRIYEGLHPDVVGEVVKASDKKLVMGPKILLVFLSSLTGFTALFVWMVKMKFDLIRLKLKINEMEK